MMGPDDWVAFVLRWSDSSVVHIVALTVILAFFGLVFRESSGHRGWQWLSLSAFLLAGTGWGYHFWRSSECALTLTQLGSEDDGLAARAYRNLPAYADPGCLIHLVRNANEDQNVRFYAACLLADELPTSDGVKKKILLLILDGTPDIRAVFFSTNEVNCAFFAPTRALSPADVINRRLDMRHAQGRSTPNAAVGSAAPTPLPRLPENP